MNLTGNRTRFTPLISNKRVLQPKYLEKLTRPSLEDLIPSWADTATLAGDAQ